MHSAFPLEQPKPILASNLKRNLLGSDSSFRARFSKRLAQYLCIPSFLLAISLIHAEQYRCPVLRVLSSCASRNGKNGVIPIVSARKKCLALFCENIFFKVSQ